MDKNSVLEVIVSFLAKKGKVVTGCNLDQMDYLDEGYVDSIGVIQFVAHLEDRFGIDFSDDDLGSQSFRTIGGLREMVESKLSLQEKK